jgi:hypothetical protein
VTNPIPIFCCIFQSTSAAVLLPGQGLNGAKIRVGNAGRWRPDECSGNSRDPMGRPRFPATTNYRIQGVRRKKIGQSRSPLSVKDPSVHHFSFFEIIIALGVCHDPVIPLALMERIVGQKQRTCWSSGRTEVGVRANSDNNPILYSRCAKPDLADSSFYYRIITIGPDSLVTLRT